ncbi:hypothetical protein H257_13330 [Aphanomyces astaci]|uniref:Uncharacterized protein n=1 Tax=Aphanomyces astaci TaxID=112090 RepID=W4FWX8_APHAT|nr:hypothetical protein H257_13330 [Aphanomyces astaci]ETV71451.1 hypothetical protein H257_13330 [Aphanomyces astaci]|eukprot:XP_009839116.1 hypothetical protein H257_13330 [Aphanomyces astaci]
MLRGPSSQDEGDNYAAGDTDDFAAQPIVVDGANPMKTNLFPRRKTSLGRSVSSSQLLLKPKRNKQQPVPSTVVVGMHNSTLHNISSSSLTSPFQSRANLHNGGDRGLSRQMSSSRSVATLLRKPSDVDSSPNTNGDDNRRDSSKAPPNMLLHFKIYLVGDSPYISGHGKPPSVDLTSLFPSGLSVLKVASGVEWGAALMQNHLVYTWGNNTVGQLGHGHSEALMRPTLVQALQSIRIVKMSCGSAHGGFVSDTGALFMVGDASYGRLGLGCLPASGIISTPTQVRWGFTQCKDKAVTQGTWPPSIDLNHLPPEPGSAVSGAPTDTFFSDVSCGDRHTLVLVKHMHVLKQVLLGFGDGSNGRLGTGSDSDQDTPTLVSVFHTAAGITFPPIREMVAGPEHSCCVTQTGELFSWGHGAYGQLGHGTCDSEWTPKRVEYFYDNVNVTAIKQATCGLHHTVVIDTTGQVFAWGRGDAGQLGGDALADSPTPVRVLIATDAGGPAVTARFVTSGRSHTVVVDSLDNVYCWGGNSAGQLGLKSTTGLNCQPIPVQVDAKSMRTPGGAVALHMHALSVFATENHTLLVLRTTNAFEGDDPNMVKAKKAVGMFKSLHAKKKPSTSPGKHHHHRGNQVTEKWSFTVAEPTDTLNIPSHVARFLHIMASTKIAKRPTIDHSKTNTSMHNSSNTNTNANKTASLTPPSRLPPPSNLPSRPSTKSTGKPLGPPKPIQGLLEWKRARTKRPPTTTFSHTPRFRAKTGSVAAVPPPLATNGLAPSDNTHPPPPISTSNKPTDVSSRVEKSATTRLLRAFGVGKRFRTVQVSVTPGPGAYDVLAKAGVPPSTLATNNQTEDDSGDKPWRGRVPFGSTAPKQVPLTTVESSAIYPEKAMALVFRKPVAVKLASGDDFSRVISKRLHAGRGSTPGPGAYNLLVPTTQAPSSSRMPSTKRKQHNSHKHN